MSRTFLTDATERTHVTRGLHSVFRVVACTAMALAVTFDILWVPMYGTGDMPADTLDAAVVALGWYLAAYFEWKGLFLSDGVPRR